MAKNRKINPLSLLQYFDPPENFIGSFGWIIGYSAGIDFLNLAAERFTGLTGAGRRGTIRLAVLLDKGNPQISIVDTPGVYHFLQKSMTTGFKLLHAKIALLYFRSQNDDDKWVIRLLISTGNWTKQTLTSSLDLVTSVDLKSEDLLNRTENAKLAQADIHVSWDLIKYIKRNFQDALLISNKKGETFFRASEFENVLNNIRKPRGVAPRFFDNRHQSLLKQLPQLITHKGTRNLLYIASGFYQESSATENAPSAVYAIRDILIGKKLLSKDDEKYLVVNPESCQCIGKSQVELKKEGWIIQKATDPLGSKRTLHAKFIFSGKVHGNMISKSWLYLGSGNITRPGFINASSSNGGNLEAGIVLTSGKIALRKGRHGKPELSSLLPVSLNETKLLTSQLQEGEPFDSDRDSHFAAPVNFFYWKLLENGDGILIPENNSEMDYQVLFNDKALAPDKEGNYTWVSSEKPLTVLVKSQSGTVKVPVVDEYGNIATSDPRELSIEEAWSQLSKYPASTGEGDEDEGEEGSDRGFGSEGKHSRHMTTSYPIRKMMELIENIAKKQTGIRECNWKIWCNRLEQVLVQCSDSEAIEIFRAMELNPLSPLKKTSFIPVYAEDKISDARIYYLDMIERVETRLHLKSFQKL